MSDVKKGGKIVTLKVDKETFDKCSKEIPSFDVFAKAFVQGAGKDDIVHLETEPDGEGCYNRISFKIALKHSRRDLERFHYGFEVRRLRPFLMGFGPKERHTIPMIAC